MKEVKMVWNSHISFKGGEYDGGRYLHHTKEHEETLRRLENEGWRIVTAGGGHGYTQSVSGFAILERERKRMVEYDASGVGPEVCRLRCLWKPAECS